MAVILQHDWGLNIILQTILLLSTKWLFQKKTKPLKQLMIIAGARSAADRLGSFLACNFNQSIASKSSLTSAARKKFSSHYSQIMLLFLELPIIPRDAYYSQNYAGIFASSLVVVRVWCLIYGWPCREQWKQYRHERNVYRAKYNAIKETCSCGAPERMKSG